MDRGQRWKRLLSEERQHVLSASSPSSARRPERDQRSAFERDYDRIIYASPFRRLQDKAQVFPLEHNDFVRTRLTHSLEVSTLGRSLGRQIGRRLKGDWSLDISGDDLGTVVATTCLAHDIGNPPFGHAGEDAIRGWFNDHPEVLEGLDEGRRLDFLHFDGNAQGVRILMVLQSLGRITGLNLTLATLAAFMKYIVPSTRLDPTRKPRKKIGYFSSEAPIVEALRARLGLSEGRHPLAFLMEAADDIAYSVADIEDGVRKQVLRPEHLVDLLGSSLKGTRHDKLIHHLEKVCRRPGTAHFREEVNAAVQWFRIEAIRAMFEGVVDAFMTHHDAILEEAYHRPLMDDAEEADVLRRTLVDIAKDNVYSAPDVLALEVFGDKVIRDLLSRFVPASLSSERHNRRTVEGKLYALISPSLRALHEKVDEDDPYARIQLAVDHVCGMTDTYAVTLYQRLNGARGV